MTSSDGAKPARSRPKRSARRSLPATWTTPRGPTFCAKARRRTASRPMGSAGIGATGSGCFRAAADDMGGSVVESSVEKTGDGGRRHLGRDRVAAVELAVVEIVAAGPELGRERSRAGVDGQDAVVNAVRDKRARLAGLPTRRHEARRKSQDIAEQIPVRDPQRERIGRAVRKARDGDPLRIDRITLEHLAKRPVDESNIGSVAAEDHVPGTPARLGGEDQVAARFGAFGEAIDKLRGLSPRPMEQDEQGSRLSGVVTLGRVEKTIPPGREAESLDPMRAAVADAGLRPRVQDARP